MKELSSWTRKKNSIPRIKLGTARPSIETEASSIYIWGYLDQCFSTFGTRPGTETWRPFYQDIIEIWKNALETS